MRINPHRDTFFNLINFKTSPETQKSKNREQSKTKNLKTKPKSHAHSKKPRNQKIKTANRILTLLTPLKMLP